MAVSSAVPIHTPSDVATSIFKKIESSEGQFKLTILMPDKSFKVAFDCNVDPELPENKEACNMLCDFFDSSLNSEKNRGKALSLNFPPTMLKGLEIPKNGVHPLAMTPTEIDELTPKEEVHALAMTSTENDELIPTEEIIHVVAFLGPDGKPTTGDNCRVQILNYNQ